MSKRKIIREYILNEIRIGRFKPNEPIYSRSQFMSKFGCARATVDLVISDLVRAKTLVAERGRGTYVSDPPKRKTGRGISVCVSDSAMGQDIIQSFLGELGGAFDLRYYTYDELKHAQSWENCKGQRFVVFIQPDVPQGPLLYDVRARGVQHLVLYRDPPESSFVSIDERGGIAAMVDALYRRGCRRIAYAGARPSRYYAPEQRYAGYLLGLLRNNLPFNQAWAGLFAPGAEKTFLDQVFSHELKPDAVIGANVVTVPFLQALRMYGLVPGKDFQVAIVDEVPADIFPFKITCQRSILGEVGRQGARAMLRMLEAPEERIQRYITPVVVEH
jgi:DNA-binding LacI/PurR family transcriptional regulator